MCSWKIYIEEEFKANQQMTAPLQSMAFFPFRKLASTYRLQFVTLWLYSRKLICVAFSFSSMKLKVKIQFHKWSKVMSTHLFGMNSNKAFFFFKLLYHHISSVHDIYMWMRPLSQTLQNCHSFWLLHVFFSFQARRTSLKARCDESRGRRPEVKVHKQQMSFHHLMSPLMSFSTPQIEAKSCLKSAVQKLFLTWPTPHYSALHQI